MKTLVVGATGATGRLLTEELLNRGHEVKVIVRSAEKLPDSFGQFLFPQFEAFYNVIILATVPAELAFAVWLLIKGVNVAQWQKHTLRVETA